MDTTARCFENWAGGDGQSVIPSSVLAEPAPRPPSTWRITPPIQVTPLRILGVGGVCWPETPGWIAFYHRHLWRHGRAHEIHSAIDRHYPPYGCLQYHTAHSNTPTENPFSILEPPAVWLRASLFAKDFHSYLLPRSINPYKSSQYQNPGAFLFLRRLASSTRSLLLPIAPVNSVNIFVGYFCTPLSRFLVLRLALRALVVPWVCLVLYCVVVSFCPIWLFSLCYEVGWVYQ